MSESFLKRLLFGILAGIRWNDPPRTAGAGHSMRATGPRRVAVGHPDRFFTAPPVVDPIRYVGPRCRPAGLPDVLSALPQPRLTQVAGCLLNCGPTSGSVAVRLPFIVAMQAVRGACGKGNALLCPSCCGDGFATQLELRAGPR
eukprot:355289-Chlamydomonas_euryale.AAC.3